MSKDAPIKVSDFLPEVDDDAYHCLDKAARKEYARQRAYGRLCAHVRQIAWEAIMDEGPRAEDTVNCVNVLTQQEWRDDPARALSDIDQLTAHWEQYAELQRREHNIPDGILDPCGIWARYARARELFGKYHAALVKLGLVAPLFFDDQNQGGPADAGTAEVGHQVEAGTGTSVTARS